MPMLSIVFRRACMLSTLVTLSLLVTCSSTPVASVALYDFELASATSVGARLPAVLRVADIAGLGWMDDNTIYYRLTYTRGQRISVYASSRWVGSPASLFDARLRNAAVGRGQVIGCPTPDVSSSRVELIDFSQILDRPGASRGAVRLRAAVSLARGVISQHVIQVGAPAPNPNAAGGVATLTQTSDETVDEVLN